MTIHQDLASLLETLQRERDELNLKLHLLKAETRDEWEKIEKQWHHFQHKAEAVGATAGQSAGEVGAAARLLGEEVRAGYRRIRDAIKAG
jgi:hypothetical protein